MRRRAGGRGCGARGRGSLPRTREAPGPDRAALRPLRREPAGLGTGHLASSQETRTRGTEIAAMERREAPAFLARGVRQDGRLVRHSVLHPLAFREGEKLVPAQAGRTTAYPAPQRIRALALGCLKFESGRRHTADPRETHRQESGAEIGWFGVAPIAMVLHNRRPP
jgi:hypothetical protein